MGVLNVNSGVYEDVSAHLHADQQSKFQNKVKPATYIPLYPAPTLFLCPWGCRIRMRPVISSTDHLGGLLAELLSGSPRCAADLFPQTSPLICWKWTRPSCLCWSSWLMKPEQVAHFDPSSDRKTCLVVNSLVWRSSFVTLLLVENVPIQMLLNQTSSSVNDDFIGFISTSALFS